MLDTSVGSGSKDGSAIEVQEFKMRILVRRILSPRGTSGERPEERGYSEPKRQSPFSARPSPPSAGGEGEVLGIGRAGLNAPPPSEPEMQISASRSPVSGFLLSLAYGLAVLVPLLSTPDCFGAVTVRYLTIRHRRGADSPHSVPTPFQAHQCARPRAQQGSDAWRFGKFSRLSYGPPCCGRGGPHSDLTCF